MIIFLNIIYFYLPYIMNTQARATRATRSLAAAPSTWRARRSRSSGVATARCRRSASRSTATTTCGSATGCSPAASCTPSTQPATWTRYPSPPPSFFPSPLLYGVEAMSSTILDSPAWCRSNQQYPSRLPFFIR